MNDSSQSALDASANDDQQTVRNPLLRTLSSLTAVPWREVEPRVGQRVLSVITAMTQPRAGWHRAILLFVLAALLVLVSELMVALFLEGGSRGLRSRRAMAWVLNTSLVYSLFLALYAFTNRLKFALVFGSALLFVVTGSHIGKMRILNRALMPWDLLNWREIVALFPTMLTNINSVVVMLVLAALLVWSATLLVRRPEYPMALWARPIVLALAISLPLPLLHYRDLKLEPYLEKMRITNRVWDNALNVRRNGLLVSLVLNARSLLMKAPEGYSEVAVLRALESAGGESPTTVDRDDVVDGLDSVETDDRMDVILYMAESFWDPTQLGIPLSRDPMPFVRQAMKERTSGELIAPVFGGGTANTEFELLTGIPMAFMPGGSYPYQHHVHRPLPSLVSEFKEHGYRTVALHPFHKWFWSRETVYPFLGFDSSQFLDSFDNARRDGPYVSDEALVDRVLAELDSSSDPTFVFAITMSTHGPFDYEPVGEPLVSVEEGLSATAAKALSNFASAIARADAAFERLTSELEKRERPALVVFFGDHLPPLQAQGVFAESGYTENLQELGLTYAERMNSVPVLFWSSAPSKRETFRVSTNYLGPRVLESAGLQLNDYFRFIDELAEELPVLSTVQVSSSDGRRHSLQTLRDGDDALSRAVQSYELLGWDRLFGAGYSTGRPTTHASRVGTERVTTSELN